MLNSLNLEQKTIVDALEGIEPGQNLLVLAGPGSGKTRTLVASLLEVLSRGGTGHKIAAITFSNNAANELRARLQAATKGAEKKIAAQLRRVQVSTFHSWASDLQSLKAEPWKYPPIHLKKAGLAVALQLMKEGSGAFSTALVDAADRHMEGSESFDEMKERNFLKVLDDKGAKDEFDRLRNATESLQKAFDSNQIQTFGRLMRSGVESIPSLPKDALEWLFIDEAQDLNRTQMEFVNALRKQTKCRVFAIADEDQGIYKFRGASTEFLSKLRALKGTTTLKLSINHRSTPTIVDWCKTWIHENGDYERDYTSSRKMGMPVVILTAQKPWERARHAARIFRHLRAKGFLGTYGEAAALSYSTRVSQFELECFSGTRNNDQNMPVEVRCNPTMPEDYFWDILDGLEKNRTTDKDWHHETWEGIVKGIRKETQGKGIAGLADLFGAIEVARRLKPDLTPAAFGKLVRSALTGVDSKGNHKVNIPFESEQLPLDTAGDRMNNLTMHTSKGLEFRVVWMTGADYVWYIAPRDTECGQPHVLGELFRWAANKLTGKRSAAQIRKDTETATRMEKRRLLYVAMSRATDLLMISAPYTEEGDLDNRPNIRESQERENVFNDLLNEMYFNDTDEQSNDVLWVNNDEDVEQFIRDYGTEGALGRSRHPEWQAPKHYRTASYSSMLYPLRQIDTRREEREYEMPEPQSYEAFRGDLFHRSMEFLCHHPDVLAKCRKGEMSLGELTGDICNREPFRAELESLLAAFFKDTTHQPWSWFEHAKVEVRFSYLEQDTVMIKGFVDLVQYDKDPAEADARIIRIVDWKTGGIEQQKHPEQLKFYARALKEELHPDADLINYYPDELAKNRLRTYKPDEK